MVNKAMNDSELLIQFTQGSGKAFAELVRRHVDLVFGAALRQVGGDRHRAEDIVQQVFLDLARKARTLTGHPTLTGWLYASTRYTALNTVRCEQRRSVREKQFDVMNTPDTGAEPRWEQIRPVIDEVLLQDLDEDDRQSVLLRFFSQQPFAAIAVQLGISENAAQKRVDRALDRLNVAFQRRGISSTAVALGVALGNSCVAAPAALAGTVAAAALAQAAGLGTGAVLAGGWKIAAVVTAVGIIGWTGVKWSQPTVVEQKAAPSLAVANVTRSQVEVTSRFGTVEPAPAALESIPRKPVERIAPQPSPVRKTYVVVRGDTLNRIARKFGVTPDAMRAENPGYNFVLGRVGDQLQLPAHATIQPPPAAIPIPADELYVVEPGDTLVKIAQKRDLLPVELRMLNPETSWEQLKVGQRIRAP